MFTAAARRGVRMAAGKMMMDRNAPAGLTDTAKRGYDQSKELIGGGTRTAAPPM